MAMPRALNKVQIIGNVGKDPEFKTFEDGNRMARFSVATTDSYKRKGTNEWVNQTEWHNISVFNKHLVGVVETHVEKGSLVYVEGSLTTRKYEKGDQTHYVTDIKLGNFDGDIKVLARDAANTEMEPDPEEDEDDGEPFKDDIPF